MSRLDVYWNKLFRKSIEIASSDQSTCLGQHRKLMQAILDGEATTARDCCIELLSGDKLGKIKNR